MSRVQYYVGSASGRLGTLFRGLRADKTGDFGRILQTNNRIPNVSLQSNFPWAFRILQVWSR